MKRKVKNPSPESIKRIDVEEIVTEREGERERERGREKIRMNGLNKKDSRQ
jgi:hypothetical protein